MLPRTCDRSGGPWAGVPGFSVKIELYQLYALIQQTGPVCLSGSHGSHTTYKHASQARTLKPCAGNTTAVKCMTGVATHNPHKRSLSTTGPRPTAGLLHICMCLQGVLARRRAGGKHTSKAASCTAHSQGRRRPAFRMPVAQMQAAPRSSAKKMATDIAGANALERARRGECGCEERKAACTRHGERLRPGRGRTPGWDWGREREGESASYPES